MNENIEYSEDFDILNAQVKSIISDSHNYISDMANISSLLFNSLSDVNWVGFYIHNEKENILELGPFNGLPACNIISVGKGVCGTAFLKDKILNVENVHSFEGHIACDSRSKSELVIPFKLTNGVCGVLDIDSPINSRFISIQKQMSDILKLLIDKY